MGRRRVNYGLILDESIRRVTFKKRKSGLLKKISELTTLCDVPACAVIYRNYSDQPDVWPSRSDAVVLLDHLHKLPIEKQTKHMLDQEGYLHRVILRATRELDKREKRSHALELRLLASGSIPNEDLNDADYSEELAVAARVLERKIIGVRERIREAKIVE